MWNYVSQTENTTGYEKYYEELKKYNKQYYSELSQEEKENVVSRVFDIYRDENIFPIRYYNFDGIVKEIQNCVDKEVQIKDNVLNLAFNQGASLCRFLFPNLHKVECKGMCENSPFDKFYNDYKLKRAIKFCLEHKSSATPVTPSGIKDGLDMIGGNVATNFKPMNAKALYEKYCPKNGIIYDFACGFGGRMLGALSSKNNYKYFGVEPCSETFDGLNILGEYIEKATNSKNRYKIYKQGSETFRLSKDNYCDFAFSSPPYYTLEKYSDEDTQCYNKFNTLSEWFDGYVYPTIENIYYMLKHGCCYAVNIADFKLGKETVEYVDRWIEISKAVGFEFVENIPMSLQTRRGFGHDETNLKSKLEGIFVFKKP